MKQNCLVNLSCLLCVVGKLITEVRLSREMPPKKYLRETRRIGL